MRPTWDDTWFNIAYTIGERSLCARDKIGAVIVSATNRIVATGYNGAPSGFEHSDEQCTSWCQRAMRVGTGAILLKGAPGLASDYSDCPALHAEANALSICDRSVREGGTIYVTSDMCMGCAKLVANSGITTVWVKATRQEHRNVRASYDFLETCGVTVYES